MANRGGPSKNVIYDSTNDTSSGRKRAVEFTGGVSVAERARLFGAQINQSSAPKPNKPEGRNQQRVQSESDQNYSYSSTQRPPNNFRSAPPQNYDRPNRYEEQPPSAVDSHDYSVINRSQRQQKQQLQQQQQPKATYQSVVYSTPQKQNHSKSTAPGEYYTTDDEVYHESQRRQHERSRSHNQNYFQPIRDPLEALYTQQPFGYSQPSVSANTARNNDGIQSFDLGNLIGRIQEDYLNNVRPYVSSVQFIENPQLGGNIGLNPSSTNRQGVSQNQSNRTTDNLYLRPGASYHYDVIDTSQFFPTYVKPMPAQNHHHHHPRRHHHHERRKHRGHYRDRASSPIDIVEKPKTPSPPPKPPTPVEETLDETEEETINTKTEEKTAEDATSEEEEDEEEEEEEEEKPAAVVPPTTTTVTTTTALANQRPGLATGTPITAATRVPVAQQESSSSESEESESSSDSDSDDSDDSDKGKRKKKSKPPPAPVSAPTRVNTRTTPQLNSRGTTQPATPTMKTVTNKNDDPPEVSNSVKSFNTQESTKSSGLRGRFNSLTSKFRRKKS